MAEPKQGSSLSRSKIRRSKFIAKIPTLIRCQHCKEKILPHRICQFCGFYRGKEILAPKTITAKNKKAEKIKEKVEKIKKEG